ncbi:MAG TPA: tetraacyldisaccharide 4'-kinase [Rhabdochlamydiaceae bacterium]|nr:tetraacyldisaccharide 4'-kinase [Rhabdochlamydiaceae bacterium]
MAEKNSCRDAKKNDFSEQMEFRKKSIKQFVLDVINGRRKGKSFLHILSYLYQGGVSFRNFAYDHRILKSKDAGIPVISIGNIVAGGSGKTPVVKFLASELLQNFHVAILSRGYQSKSEKMNFQITVKSKVAECGDEPFWLAKQLPKAQVWVGKDRFISAQKAKKQGAQLIILDDGMQHRQLKRDFEIVVVDGTDPWGRGFFLPRGFLRDAPSRLKIADLVVVTEALQGVEEELKKYTKAPMITVRVKPMVSLQGKRVAVFCAIGNPDRFLKTIKEAGGEVVASFFKPDHAFFTARELEQYAGRCKADLLVCTEKDFVKLPSSFKMPIFALPTQLEICQGRDIWDQLLQKVYNDRRISSHAP